jgi:hypothetical protein
MVAFLVKWSSMWSIGPQNSPLPPGLQARGLRLLGLARD